MTNFAWPVVGSHDHMTSISVPSARICWTTTEGIGLAPRSFAKQRGGFKTAHNLPIAGATLFAPFVSVPAHEEAIFTYGSFNLLKEPAHDELSYQIEQANGIQLAM